MLPTGKVLLAGGSANNSNIDTAELFEPLTGTFSDTGVTMISVRALHAGLLLPDGKVLFTGGGNDLGAVVNTAELYTP